MQKTLLSILLPAAAIIASGPLNAASGLRCEAMLSGAQEVPDVMTDASGRIVAMFDAAFTRVHVRLRVRGAPTADGAHFHCARPGANGPVAFGLVSPGPLFFDGGVVKGMLVNDDFTGADCVGSVDRPVNNIAALAFAMRDGLVYINVHTLENPGGEIRGQMMCKGKGKDDDDDDSSSEGEDPNSWTG